MLLVADLAEVVCVDLLELLLLHFQAEVIFYQSIQPGVKLLPPFFPSAHRARRLLGRALQFALRHRYQGEGLVRGGLGGEGTFFDEAPLTLLGEQEFGIAIKF